MSASSSQQGFHFSQKAGPLGGGSDASKTLGGADIASSVLSFGRSRSGGKGDYTRSPTMRSAGGSILKEARYSRHEPYGAVNGLNSNSNPNATVSTAARDTLIALNNMAKRPGYRTLGGELETVSPSKASVIDGGGGRETPTSMRTMGSAGQTWLGATSSRPEDRDSSARFKGRAGRESYHSPLASGGAGGGAGRTKRSSSHGSDSNVSSRMLPIRDGSRLAYIDDSKDEEPYTPNGVGLGSYAATLRSEAAQMRMAELKRSASVASSGILDRLTSSPPPAVPELPPSATTMTTTGSSSSPAASGGAGGAKAGMGGFPAHRSSSPTPSESSSIQSHGGVQSGLGLATKVQYPYGRNNEILVHSHSGSLNSTSGASATAAASNNNNGPSPLRPPPARGAGQLEDRERERAALREKERAEKEREAAAERARQREREKAEARYSRPPPEYVPTPTPTASHTSLGMVSQSTLSIGGTGGLQRQGTRTGDILIGIEGGAGFGGYDSESQDSHSVAHAFVSTAQHVVVSPSSVITQPQAQPPAALRQQPPQPPRPQHQGPVGSTGSSNLGLPHSSTTVTGTGAAAAVKQAVTPDRGRAYDPGRAVAVSSGTRSNTPTRMGAPAWVGRSSEERSRGGVEGQGVVAVGRPIMDDRARLAVGAGATANLVGGQQPISRVSPA